MIHSFNFKVNPALRIYSADNKTLFLLKNKAQTNTRHLAENSPSEIHPSNISRSLQLCKKKLSSLLQISIPNFSAFSDFLLGTRRTIDFALLDPDQITFSLKNPAKLPLHSLHKTFWTTFSSRFIINSLTVSITGRQAI